MVIKLKGFDEIAESFMISPQQLTEMSLKTVEAVTDAILFNWRDLASDGLKSTRDIYLRNLFKPEIQVNNEVIRGSVVLTGQLPSMIENGAGVFDMKAGFKLAKNVKQKKNGGWYMTIKFRFGVPTSLGENEAFSNVMPKAIHNVAKNLIPSVSQPEVKISSKYHSTNYKYGKSLTNFDIPSPLDKPKTRAGYGSYGSYTHKDNIYKGMIKQVKIYEKKAQVQYATFRRVSDTSDPNSWIHPGFVAKNFAEKAVEQTDIEMIQHKVALNFFDEAGI